MSTVIFKPWILALLLGLFVAAGIFGGPANSLEAGLMHRLAQTRHGWPELTAMVGGVTSLGGAYVTLSVTAAASLWLLLHRAPARALLLALTVLVERSLVEGLKAWIGRPRPTFGVDWLPGSLAYPSGHSANSMTAFLLTALVLAPPASRAPWAIGGLILSFIVGLSRVYLGVHWPSDVVGGWALGMIAVAIAVRIGRRSSLLRFEPQHQIVGRHRLPGGEDEAA